MICQICSNAHGNRSFQAKEMMFGLRDTFEYFECGSCQCVQLAEIPADLSRYYPSNYYAFSIATSAGWRSKLRDVVVDRRNHYAVFGAGVLGRPLHALWPEKEMGLQALQR